MRMVEVRILPPQPVFFHRKQTHEKLLALGCWQSRGDPTFPAAVHRFHVGVAHLLQIFRRQRGAEAAAAVEDEFCLGIEYGLFDVALNDAFPQVDRSRNMSVAPFVVLANIDQEKFFSGIDAALDFGYVRLFDLLLRLIDQLQKLRRVRHKCAPFEILSMRAYHEPISRDRKSTRLNSSHRCISYAVFCLKKKKKTYKHEQLR